MVPAPRAAARFRADREKRPVTRHGLASLRLAAHALRAVIALAAILIVEIVLVLGARFQETSLPTVALMVRRVLFGH